MDTTTKRIKPRTATERRAEAFARLLARHGRPFDVEWHKSRTWGQCPRIRNLSGEVVATATGCGYDKRSAVVADLLRWLGRDDEEHGLIFDLAGTGTRNLIERFNEIGLGTLTHVHEGRTVDVFQFTRCPVYLWTDTNRWWCGTAEDYVRQFADSNVNVFRDVRGDRDEWEIRRTDKSPGQGWLLGSGATRAAAWENAAKWLEERGDVVREDSESIRDLVAENPGDPMNEQIVALAAQAWGEDWR